MEPYTDFATYLTIILIPLSALAFAYIWFDMLDVPSLLNFKPFNCFTCLTFWATVILTLLYWFDLLTFESLIIQTTISVGFLLGYYIDTIRNA